VLHSSKRWCLWKQPVVGWHWWLRKELVVMCGNYYVGQATSQQVFKVTTFCTDTCFQSFFATDQLHRAPRCAEIQPMSQQDASVTCPYRGLVLDTLASCPDVVITRVEVRTVQWPHVKTDEVSYSAEAQLCHEHDVLAHCLAGRQTSPEMLRIAGSSFCISNTSPR